MINQILIPQELTADVFGCDVSYFSKYIRGKVVTVVSETPHFKTIKDQNGEEWTVNKKDLSPKTNDEEVIEAHFKKEKRQDTLMMIVITICCLTTILFGTIYGDHIDQFIEQTLKQWMQ